MAAIVNRSVEMDTTTPFDAKRMHYSQYRSDRMNGSVIVQFIFELVYKLQSSKLFTITKYKYNSDDEMSRLV